MSFVVSLRIRVFDSNGKKVVDKPESKLTREERFTALKEKLKALKLFDPAIEMTLRGVLLEESGQPRLNWTRTVIGAIF
jgi:hypothetical protein